MKVRNIQFEEGTIMKRITFLLVAVATLAGVVALSGRPHLDTPIK